MNILLVAATVKEIAPFFEYYRHSARPQQVDVLITGIGLTAATYHILKQLTIKKPDLVIQAGVAGCFDNKMLLGSVVIVKKEAIADQSVIEMKTLKTLFDLELLPQDQFPYTKKWLVNNSEILSQVKLENVTAISVNEITTSKEKVKLYKEVFNPAIESLEGAALHYVCLMEKIPFVQLRAVSNYVTERNKKKWELERAIEHLNKELIAMIEKF